MWTLELPTDFAVLARQIGGGSVLVIDLDPRQAVVRIQAGRPGLGNALVGQRVIFRRWLGTGDGPPIAAEELAGVLQAAHRWLDSPEAARQLAIVTHGYQHERLWSGDELGEWTPEAWDAAHRVVSGVIDAMEQAPDTSA